MSQPHQPRPKGIGAASLALGREWALTPAANSALKSARLALIALQMALVRSMETPPKSPLPPPPY